MLFEIYIDESYSQVSGDFVLAGYIAEKSQWDRFTPKWNELLGAFGRLDDQGTRHFHMNEMVSGSSRDFIPAFFRVIEEFVMGRISVQINSKDLEQAFKRIWVPSRGIDWGKFTIPYNFAYRALMDTFHSRRDELTQWIPLHDEVNFIFDEIAHQKLILETWGDYLKDRPKEYRQRYGDAPRFLDDKKCPPLQAADFFAWWCRKCYEEKAPREVRHGNFDGLRTKGEKNFLGIEISYDQERIVSELKRLVRSQIKPAEAIYDLKPTKIISG